MTFKAVGMIFLMALVFVCGANSQDVEQSYALVKGTVFTNIGRSFPGVEVEIIRVDVEERHRKATRQKARSDKIGEFAFRLPSGPSEWKLIFRAKDFVEDEREIEVFSDERVDITVLMQPEG